MTSMLATSMTFAGAIAVAAGTAFIVESQQKRPPARSGEGLSSRRSALLRAVARRELLFVGVFLRRLFDHRLQHFVVGLIPVADDFPLGAVPLLNATGAGAFVIAAAHLEW